MEITPRCVVGLTWQLRDTLGETLDVLDEPVEFYIGGHDLLEKIESALQGYGPGAELQLQLEPEEAFGDFDDQLLFLEPRTLFPPGIDVGMAIDGAALPPGVRPEMPRDVRYTVTDVYPEHLVLDGNHPLAGIALRLQLRVDSVREATEAEHARASLGVGFFRVEPQHGAAGDATLH